MRIDFVKLTTNFVNMAPELPWLRPIMADEYALTTRISSLRVKILLEAIIDMRSTGPKLFYIVSCREILGSAAI